MTDMEYPCSYIENKISSSLIKSSPYNTDINSFKLSGRNMTDIELLCLYINNKYLRL